jgi:hypothetical protein
VVAVVMLAALSWAFLGGPQQVVWVALLLTLVKTLLFSRSDSRADPQAAQAAVGVRLPLVTVA